jgi:TonB family protein
MKSRLIIKGIYIFTFVSGLAAPQAGPAQAVRAGEARVEMLDPESLYSFSGLDGRGFLRRGVQNMPQPYFTSSETGIVPLIFTITPSGRVSDVQIERFSQELATEDMIEAARTAVLNWQFQPLPPRMVQQDEEVRVVIQYNSGNSGRLYSHDGLYTIEGLQGRRPLDLPAPKYATLDEGVVTVILTLSPSGEIAWIDQFYGAYPHLPAKPRLGLITHEAVRKWKFSPLPESAPQEDQQIKIVFRYLRWPVQE